MHEKGVTLEIAGQERFLVMTTAALEIITEKYGGVEEMAEVFQGPTINEWDSDEVRAEKETLAKKANVNVFKVAPWLVSVLADQGEMLRRGKTSLADEEQLTEAQIKLHTTPKDIKQLMQAAMQAIAVGFGTEHVTDSGDPVLAEMEREEKKNAEGAAE